MNQTKEIQTLIDTYVRCIENPNKEDFLSIWSGTDNDTLISISNLYRGRENIYQEFVLDKIHQLYATIKLIAEPAYIHFIDENNAIVIFSYHTECIRKETGEEYGIQGIETQVVTKINGSWKYVHIHYSKA